MTLQEIMSKGWKKELPSDALLRTDPIAYDSAPKSECSGLARPSYVSAMQARRNGVQPIPRCIDGRALKQIERLILRDGLFCHWCGFECDPKQPPNHDLFPTREHLIRRADGGSSRMENLKIACRKCNGTRHDRDWLSVKLPALVERRHKQGIKRR